MSKKLCTLIKVCVSAVGAVAGALVAYFQPPMTPAIVGAIGIAVPAANEILDLFVVDKDKK